MLLARFDKERERAHVAQGEDVRELRFWVEVQCLGPRPPHETLLNFSGSLRVGARPAIESLL